MVLLNWFLSYLAKVVWCDQLELIKVGQNKIPPVYTRVYLKYKMRQTIFKNLAQFKDFMEELGFRDCFSF